MKKEKKKWIHKIFKYVSFILFITFITLYVSQATGYYEYQNHQKVTLTEEGIKQFEKDVADGKKIDIQNYLQEPARNYDNKASRIGGYLSEQIGNYVKKGLDGAFKLLNQFLESEE